MKVVSALVVIAVSSVLGEAPYPASGWKPKGALLVLPARQRQQPQQQYGPPPKPIKLEYGPPAAPEPRPNRGDQAPSELERLRQKAGAESGIYHILLPDGRLQKVEYATAPILDIESRPAPQQQWNWADFRPTGSLVQKPNPVVAQFLRLREQQRKPTPVVTMTPARYLASIEYSDVQPVPPPVFAYKEPGLVRIIRTPYV